MFYLLLFLLLINSNSNSKKNSNSNSNKGNALGGLACITQFNMINQNVNDVALIRISQQQIS